MEPSALVFLKTESAQRLAVAWHHLTDERTDGAWAAAAGLAVSSAQSVGHVLRVHAICRDDGTTDQLALQFIATESTQWIKKKRKPS